jgi:histidinol-phosphate aminotransferase
MDIWNRLKNKDMKKENFDLQAIIRPNLRAIKPYSSARDEFSGEASVFLDANENSLGSSFPKNFNRYPDPHQKLLKESLAALKGISVPEIFLGNGSDEAIDLIYRAFCIPGKDKAILLPPTYGMYEVSAEINDVKTVKVSLTDDFQVDVEEILAKVDENTKLIWVCSPNNPTANTIESKRIFELLNNFNGIVVVDEAYIDFADAGSWISQIREYPNLIVLQTFSKAWGLAEIRLGMAFAQPGIIDILSKIKPPYNVNGVTQKMALKALSNYEQQKEMVQLLISERKMLENELTKYACIEKIYPSDANFILIKTQNAKDLYQFFTKQGIVVRDRSSQTKCDGCIRITVGTPAENVLLLKALKAYDNPSKKNEDNMDFEFLQLLPRIAEVHRKTNETDVRILLNLDGTGLAKMNTGIAFFDHMLEQLARHSGCDMTILAKGDIHIDEHHTIEDVGITLGEAFAKALGDKRGIERYGFLLPMDEALAQAAIDFSGRPYLIWQANFKRERVGEMPTEMVEHFFKAFSDNSRCNLNIKAEGENEHHIIEGIFKAVAKSIKMAVKRNENNMQLPSTKGKL